MEIEADDDEVVRVENANELNRGGMLRLGAVLTATSAPLRTSPVKRGDWLLRRVLGTPTPPPPPDAGSIAGRRKLIWGPDDFREARGAQAQPDVRRLPRPHRPARLPAREL
jgi:hypothetical protein